MKTTSTMPATNDALLVPRALAAEATIGGLTAPSLRLAIVLATSAFHGAHGQWAIIKPDLEVRTGVVLDNATRLLEPLHEAMLEKGDSIVKLFDIIDYEPGVRFKTAGMITVRLSFAARELLSSQMRVVRLPIDELRSYSTISGIMLRMRLGARMQDMKTSKLDEWRLQPNDFAKSSVFGSYANIALIKRTNAAGEETNYVSLSRADAKLLRKGVAEINVRSRAARVEIRPIKNSADPKSRWREIYLDTRLVHEAKPAKKPSLNQLNRASKAAKKQPAIAR